MNPDSETALELETIALCQQLGYTTANCRSEWEGGTSKLVRQSQTEVVLTSQLRPALQRLNPQLPPETIDQAIDILTRDRRAFSLANANRETYRYLKDGIPVTYNRDNRETTATLRLIDWRNPANNHYFLASQLSIDGDIYTRRPDLLAFINGIPLIFIELKAHTVAVKEAYTDNFSDYKKTIPQLFWYNAAVILSNGSQAGSITAPWEHFSEGETGTIDLETLLRGVCHPEKLLDLIENFIIFADTRGGLTKILARNHQYLGVNQAIASVANLQQNRGRLGVFWHTQGSGKSYSMQFFAQKVLRVLPGNWTFVVICDRDDLDNQIYQNFAQTGAVTEPEQSLRATSGEHLKQLLTEDHRYIFTLIQKFRTAKLAKEKPALDEQFKDPENPLRIVFVCAMWMTGFDVPSCSTVYLDKPMKNHTLMQTIARANRVFLDKNNGLIVDYIGVFRDLQNALAIYGAASGGGVAAGEMPVQPKTELVESLKEAIAQTADFLKQKQIDLQEIENTATVYQRIAKFDAAREAILSSETSKLDYVLLSRKVAKLYKAILPDAAAGEFSKKVAIIGAIAKHIRELNPPDIREIKEKIEKILDESVETLEYAIPAETPLIDLSQLDIEALTQRFNQGRKNTETERLKNAISAKIERMLKQNQSRVNFYHKFQELIDKYNLASRNVEAFFTELIEFARELNQEESRALAEGLDEEKLAIFDLLIQPELELTDKDKKAVKKIAEELLKQLQQEKLALDWRNRQQSRAAVQVIIEQVLDTHLPEAYSKDIYDLKCQELYQHIYENYGEVA